MNQSKCLAVGKDKIEIIDANPCIDFLINVLFVDGVKISKRAVNYNEENLRQALDTLNERERSVIMYLYGINCERKSVDEVSAIYEVSYDRIEEFRNKVLRKLKNPSRTQYLTGIPYSNNNKIIRRSIWRRNIINTIKKEIESICKHKEEYDFLYIPRLMKHYGFILQIDDASCDDMDTNVLQTLVFIYENQKTVYKYYVKNIEEIVDSIFNEMLVSLNSKQVLGSPIFNTCLSSGLQNLLLMKGYLFYEEVCEEAEKLAEQLNDFGFKEFADELLVQKMNIVKSDEEEQLIIYPIDEEVFRFINENQSLSTIDLINKIKEANNEVSNSLLHNLESLSELDKSQHQ